MAVLEALPSRNIVIQMIERDWRKLLVSEGAFGGAQHACLPCSAEQSAPEELEFPPCDIALQPLGTASRCVHWQKKHISRAHQVFTEQTMKDCLIMKKQYHDV